jgi:hypothetical protein
LTRYAVPVLAEYNQAQFFKIFADKRSATGKINETTKEKKGTSLVQEKTSTGISSADNDLFSRTVAQIEDFG